MKVIKPMMSGLLWRVYRRNGYRMAVTQMVCFPFGSPDRPLTEPVMWTKIASELPKDTVWDAGIPKDRGELLLSSRAYAPGSVPVESMRVRVRAGTIMKELDIHGDRNWVKTGGGWVKSRPEAFLSMPVDYSLSFGGEGYPPNPTGKGFDENPDRTGLPLPNIESPHFPLVSPQDTTPPAGFGALDLSWSERRLKSGSYQPGEIGKDPPDLPANADWTLNNQAPSDQWLSGFWKGGEEYLLEGLHPDWTRQSGTLPTIRARSFASLAGNPERSFVEIPMHPETVWLFPHLEIGIVIHRGSLPVETDDGSEISSLLLALEDPEDNRPESHYLSFRNRRIARDPDDWSLYGDAPLLPKRLKDDPQANIGDIQYHLSQPADESSERTKRIIAKKLEEAAAREPISGLPPESQASPRIGEALRSQNRKVGEILKDLESASAETPLGMLEKSRAAQPGREALKQKMEEKIRDAIAAIPDSVLSRQNISREDAISAISTAAPLKKDIEDSFSGERLMERLRSGESSTTGNSPLSGDDLETKAKWLQDKLSVLKDKADTLVRSVHLFSPPPKDPPRAAAGRQKVLDHLKASRDFTGWSLRNADLSRLDLSGCDFSGSDLIGCDFSESNLSGSHLLGVWAAHASLCRADLSRSRWDGANLGHADLTGVHAIAASFEGSILSGATLSGSNLSGSRFDGSDLSNALFSRVTAKGCSFPEVRFMRIEGTASPSSPGTPGRPAGEDPSGERTLFEEVDFSGSDLEKSVFMKSDFLSVDFSSCRLSGATFLDCSGPSTVFDGAVLSKAVFVQSIDFRSSSFQGSDLSGANLRGVNLSGSNFQKSILAGCDGSGGDWQQTRLQGVRAIGARFLKSDLRLADCRSGDFRQAVFQNADLRFSDFSRASLYKACTNGAKVDESTVIDQALLGKTTLSPGGGA